MKWIVLKSTAIDERSPIRQDNHAITEHIPGDGLRGNSARLWIPYGSSQISIRWIIPRARNYQNFPIVHQSHMHGINGHEIRQSTPLSLHVSLCHRAGLRCGNQKEEQCKARNAAPRDTIFHGYLAISASCRKGRSDQHESTNGGSRYTRN